MLVKIIFYTISLLEIFLGTYGFISLWGAYKFIGINIVIFVFFSSLISLFLGLGILARINIARRLLIFFSFYIIFTKLLIFLKIIYLPVQLYWGVNSSTKDLISIFYHLSLIGLLSSEKINKRYFNRLKRREK